MDTNHLIIYLRGSITEYEKNRTMIYFLKFSPNYPLTNQGNGGGEVA